MAEIDRGGFRSPPVYLSRLWTDFQNSFVWWKLLKIVIDFYSISNFLSFIVWPLEVAEVTKVSRINIFKQKIKFRNFWATSMLYTSKERIFHVEFKFKQKSRVYYWKVWKKFNFSILGSKTRLTRCLRWVVSQFFWQQNSKMALPEVVKRFEAKSHQIWAQYLQPVRNGGRLSPRGGSRSPPHLLGLKERCVTVLQL